MPQTVMLGTFSNMNTTGVGVADGTVDIGSDGMGVKKLRDEVVSGSEGRCGLGYGFGSALAARPTSSKTPGSRATKSSSTRDSKWSARGARGSRAHQERGERVRAAIKGGMERT